MVEVRQTAQFMNWFTGLRDLRAKAQILRRIGPAEAGNIGDVKFWRPWRDAYRLRAGLSPLFYEARQRDHHTALGWRQGITATGLERSEGDDEGTGMMAIGTTRWDITEHLDSDAAIAAYLEAVFDDGDPLEIRRALGHVARARGMTEIAQQAGITRAGLYKALGEGGNPFFDLVAKVLKAVGVRLAVAV